MRKKFIMKKTAMLLASAILSVSMITGCGDASTKQTPKSITDSTEATIAYITESYEKDSKPKKVIIFENGTATLYNPGSYTMGDFAKMTDEEIENNLLGIIEDKNTAEIEKYQGYLTEKQSDVDTLKASLLSIQNNQSCGTWLEAVILNGGKDLIYTLGENNPEYLETNYEMLYIWEENFGIYVFEHLTNVNLGVCEALYYNLFRENTDELFGQGTSLAEDWQSYMARHEGEKFAPIFSRYINTSKYDLDDIQAATELFDTVITEGINTANNAVNLFYQEMIDDMQKDIDSYNQKITELQNKTITGENYPTAISLITDGTGNNVSMECIVMLSEDDIEYAIGLKGVVYSEDSRVSVYESQYAVYGVSTDGSNVAGFMLVRDDTKNGIDFSLDTLETKDVFIDAEKFSDFTK